MLDKHTPRRSRERIRRQQSEDREPKFSHDWRYFSGTLYEMPIEEPLQTSLNRADLAIKNAQSVRKMHARKKNGRRTKDIEFALDGLKEAMRPIRHNISRLAYLPETKEGKSLRRASDALQRERRKLWKMKAIKTKKKKEPQNA